MNYVALPSAVFPDDAAREAMLTRLESLLAPQAAPKTEPKAAAPILALEDQT